jgi:hypothetical protein
MRRKQIPPCCQGQEERSAERVVAAVYPLDHAVLDSHVQAYPTQPRKTYRGGGVTLRGTIGGGELSPRRMQGLRSLGMGLERLGTRVALSLGPGATMLVPDWVRQGEAGLGVEDDDLIFRAVCALIILLSQRLLQDTGDPGILWIA